MIGERPSHPIADSSANFGTDGSVVFQRALSDGVAAAKGGSPITPIPAEAVTNNGGPATIAANAYTFAVIDSLNLISAAQEAQITASANYVIGLISHYISWKGTLDFVVDIRPASQSPYPNADGILPTVAQIAWDGSGWVNQTLAECLTGADADPARPDAGCTIYLAADGTIRNYGSPVWFDPNPRFGFDPNVPAGTADFIGIYTHEIFHSLGFYASTREWMAHSVTEGDIAWFTGAKAAALYGGQLPFVNGTDHYGYTADPAIPISHGLMFQWGNYERNRLDIGRIDLAVLADLGHKIKTYDGLPLFELLDTALDLAGTGGNDTLYGDYHANGLDGGAGNDLLDGGGSGDRMSGGTGDDRFFVDNPGDVVTESAGQGSDRVLASVSWTATAGSSIEVLTTTDNLATAAINFIGNGLAQYLYGNAGPNRLDGGGGGDVLVGLGGNDIFTIRNAIDRVIESIGGGNDRVLAAVNWVLSAGAEVETMSTTDQLGTAAIRLTGNTLSQYIFGNAGANVLDGGGGGDGLVGLGGDDLYYVRSAADRVVEAAGAGSDRLLAATSFTLEANSAVEILATIDNLATTAIDLTGNALRQHLYGNAGANTLDGKTGADVLIGLGGADSFAFTSALGGGNVARITDFVSATDKVALGHTVFTGLGLGALNPNAFYAGAAAHDADDRIVYNSATGALYFDADGTGAGAALQFATLDTHPVIAASDFTVI